MALDVFREHIDNLTFSVVDTETTGMSPKFCRVMDIGIVHVKNGKIINTWEQLIDPKQNVDPVIEKYTHLNNNSVRGKPSFDKILPFISKKLENTIFVAHNLSFDYSFLREEFARHNKTFHLPALCTVKLSRSIFPFLGNFNLDVLSEHFGINIINRHRALPDAHATALILCKIIETAKRVHNAKNFRDLEKLQFIHVSKDSKEYGLFKEFKP